MEQPIIHALGVIIFIIIFIYLASSCIGEKSNEFISFCKSQNMTYHYSSCFNSTTICDEYLTIKTQFNITSNQYESQREFNLSNCKEVVK